MTTKHLVDFGKEGEGEVLFKIGLKPKDHTMLTKYPVQETSNPIVYAV